MSLLQRHTQSRREKKDMHKVRTFNPWGERGQATAEYALVMLAAAALAGGVLAWVVSSDAVSRLMDAVLDSVIGQVNP